MVAKNDLRVLSGRFKGAPLKSPQTAGTHPMGSREKLALFNMLGPNLADAVVLDAYAGTGALGIEALSRGALSATFVEKSPPVARLIRENLQRLGQNLSYEVYSVGIDKFTKDAAQAGKYSLIFTDPPYDHFSPLEIATLSPLLKTDGILVLSFPFASGAPEFPDLELQTVRRYSAAGIAIYRQKTD